MSDEGTKTTPLLCWSAVGIAGLVWLLALVAGAQPVRAWRGLLIAFLYVTPLAGGLATWSAILACCRTRWMGDSEKIPLSALSFALPSLLVLALLWFYSPAWSPWYGRSFHQGLWLNNHFIFARDMAALLIFWWNAWRYRVARRRGPALLSGGFLVFTYCMVFSLLGFDLVMALDSHWYSSLFGGYLFITGLYAGIAAWALCAAAKGQKKVLPDTANLMLAFGILSTYMMFSQLLPIWYENLPEEIRFAVPRMNFLPWMGVSYALLALIYLGPILLFLPASWKKRRGYMFFVSALLLAGMFVERWWLVAPTFSDRACFGGPELAPLLLLAGLLGVGMTLSRPRLGETK